VTAPDAENMSYAQDHGYVVIINDLDFSAILAATNGTGPSVVQIRSTDLRPAAISAPVLNALAQWSKSCDPQPWSPLTARECAFACSHSTLRSDTRMLLPSCHPARVT
jgi:hypothetical protein